MSLPHEPWTSEDSPPGTIAAATLIVLRESADGAAPEVLVVQRAQTLRFAGGAIVFPGGRVDEGDAVLAARLAHGLPPHDATSRVAAIRETIEETGVAVGLTPVPSAGTVAAIRADLLADGVFADALDRHGLSLDLSALEPFSRWCPFQFSNVPVSRVFDTRFYVARAPDDAHLATADERESVRLRWAGAADILGDCAAGREFAIFPTLRNLERLALGASYEAVLAHSRGYPTEVVTPWFEERDGQKYLCIPDYLGYPVTAELADGVRRG